MLQNLNDLIFILDRNGVFLKYHSRDTDQLIVPVEYFIGKKVKDVLPQNISLQFENAIRLLINGESKHESFEYSLQLKNQEVWYDASITYYKEDSSEENRILVSIRNVSKIVTDRILLQQILSTSSDGIMVAEAIRNQEDKIIDFKWLLANEAAARLGNKSIKDYVGQSFLQTSEIAKEHNLIDTFVHVVESEESRIIEKEIKIENSSKWFHIEASKLNDGFVVRFRDTTKIKQDQLKAKRNITIQKVFITQAPSAIAMLDNRLNYLACSAKWLEDYNLVGHDLIGKNHYSVFPEITERWKEIHRQSLEGKIRKVERDLFVRPDGSEVWLKWQSRPWYDENGEIGGIILNSEDITEKEKSKERLSELNTELQLANNQKNQLFSVLAHDLRSPLSSIYTMLGILNEDSESISRGELSSYISMVYDTSKNMQELLDDLLLWSKEQMGNNQFKPESIIIQDIVDSIVNEQEANFFKKQIRVNIQLQSSKILFDQGSLKVIIRNFITNAIKFSKQEGLLEIIGRIQDDKYYFGVQDHGIGMDSMTLQRIKSNTNFESAWGTSGEKGVGIGLSICRSFLHKGNGEFIIESEQNKGTLVAMLLPLAP